MTILAIIPARGGSKAIPNKNIATLKGKPLIAWTIEQANQCELIDQTIVSTDSQKIADIAIQYNGFVPILRPAHLATDTTPDLPVYQHILDWLGEHQQPEIVVWLRPTSPLRQVEGITHAIDKLRQDSSLDCVRSVTQAHHHPYWMKTFDDNSLQPFIKGHDETVYYRRQMLPPAYYLNGSIDVVRVESVKRNGVLFGGKMGGYITEPEHSLDIDSPIDLQIAETLLYD